MWLILPALLVLHVMVCFLLVLIVLMQLPRSEGLGAAFGGGVTENIFGAQTTHVLSRFTVWLGVAFFALTLLLAVAYTKQNSAKTSKVQRELMSAPVPIAAPVVPAAAVVPSATAAPSASPAVPAP
ncbi:MAG: preprotein translocase subunit SecG [Verrucomicrobiota bacterium]